MKKKIAIVAGGDSSEHEVSLRSAAGILSFMDAERYDCRIVAQRGQSMHVLDGERQYPVNLHDFSYEVDGKRQPSISLTSPSMVRPAKTVFSKVIST